VWIAVALAIVTAAVFFQVRTHQFILYDDPEYVTNNREVRAGLNWHGLLWSFRTFTAGNWHPLTWISHMVDVQLFGLNSGAHHLVNVGLHVAATVLLFLFLYRATGAQWKSLFVAGVFAIHPLHVESVAWVAERKDVLSGLLLILGIGAYLAYAARPSLLRYIGVLLAFVAALMAKPTAVTFPALLLLLDVWPLGRWRLAEKLPLFLMSGIAASLTFVAQRSSGAVASVQVVSPAERLANAAVSYVVYIAQFIWPARLAPFYPYLFDRPLWESAAATLIVIGLTIAAIVCFKWQPAVTVGWFWYVISLVPMIGLIQAGAQAHADRYMYIPSIGLAIMLAWGGGQLGRHLPSACRKPVLAMVVLIAGIWGVLTWQDTTAWHDTVSLFSHAIAAGHDSVTARHQLGLAFKEKGQLDQAIDEFEHAVRLAPSSAQERHALGKTLLAAGKANLAAAELSRAVQIEPGQASIHTDLATALLQSGNVSEALREYTLAIDRDPSNADARAGYGGALIAIGRTGEGIRELTKVLPTLADRVAANPDNADAHYDLGTYYAYTNQTDKATQEFYEVTRLRPTDVDAHFNLGVSLAAGGRYEEALPEFREAAELNPGSGRPHLFLGKCLLALKRYQEARQEFRTAIAIDPAIARAEPGLEHYLQ